MNRPSGLRSQHHSLDLRLVSQLARHNPTGGGRHTVGQQAYEADELSDDPDKTEWAGGWNELDQEAAGADSRKQYSKTIGKVALLSAEEEVDLAKRIEVGLFAGHKLVGAEAGEIVLPPELVEDLEHLVTNGLQARNHLIEANTRFVFSVAKSYLWSGMSLTDLTQEGIFGLFPAVEQFDYTLGYKFITFAKNKIHHSIMRGVDNTVSNIRIPVHRREQIRVMRRTIKDLRNSGLEATTTAVAAEMELEPEKVYQLMIDDRLGKTASLDDLMDNGVDVDELGDFRADQQPIDPLEGAWSGVIKDTLRTALGELSDREREIVVRRWGLFGHMAETREKVSRDWGCAGEWIRQIQRRAENKLSENEALRALVA